MDAPGFSLEVGLRADGFKRLVGIDEAGRGALAGPVVAGAVVFATSDERLAARLLGVRDSKQMTVSQRQTWQEKIPSLVLAHSVGAASAREVDQHGIVPATRIAIGRALDGLNVAHDHLLLDHIRLPMNPLPQLAIPKGDQISLSIAAASILAKTHRDELMIAASATYPHYGFERHKGYGTAAHLAVLERQGPCKIHRRSFATVETTTVLSSDVRSLKTAIWLDRAQADG